MRWIWILKQSERTVPYQHFRPGHCSVEGMLPWYLHYGLSRTVWLADQRSSRDLCCHSSPLACWWHWGVELIALPCATLIAVPSMWETSTQMSQDSFHEIQAWVSRPFPYPFHSICRLSTLSLFIWWLYLSMTPCLLLLCFSSRKSTCLEAVSPV